MKPVNSIGKYLATRWKSFKYVRDPRKFWEERGSKDDFEKYPPEIYSVQVEFLREKFLTLGVGPALEIGCGYGRILTITRNCVGDPWLAVGLDFGYPQLKKAKFLSDPTCRLLQATATDLKPVRFAIIEKSARNDAD
ncbi:MAG TPA: hypothetical protein VGR30_01785 [Candidatus Binatia bacterium]|jgi:SAM-dependent methyltransferase|nr:hypothetical protein [Candidatus Binatia bacterium]